MDATQLPAYIQDQIAQGKQTSEILSELVVQGWDQATVQAAIDTLAATPPPTASSDLPIEAPIAPPPMPTEIPTDSLPPTEASPDTAAGAPSNVAAPPSNVAAPADPATPPSTPASTPLQKMSHLAATHKRAGIGAAVLFLVVSVAGVVGFSRPTQPQQLPVTAPTAMMPTHTPAPTVTPFPTSAFSATAIDCGIIDPGSTDDLLQTTQTCLQPHINSCSPAGVVVTATEEGLVQTRSYEIIGKRGGACLIKVIAAVDPNPEAQGKDMSCKIPTSADFFTTIQDLKLCSGPLWEAMKSAPLIQSIPTELPTITSEPSPIVTVPVEQ